RRGVSSPPSAWDTPVHVGHSARAGRSRQPRERDFGGYGAAFFTTALLFWWPIVRPAPRLHPSTHPGFEILYLLAATAQNTALGVLLTVPEHSFYPYYEQTAVGLGVNAVDEQMAAGGIMWVSGHMYLLPILLMLYNFARRSAGDDAVDVVV